MADRLELSDLGEMWILTSDEARQHSLTGCHSPINWEQTNLAPSPVEQRSTKPQAQDGRGRAPDRTAEDGSNLSAAEGKTKTHSSHRIDSRTGTSANFGLRHKQTMIHAMIVATK